MACLDSMCGGSCSGCKSSGTSYSFQEEEEKRYGNNISQNNGGYDIKY